MFGGDRFGPGEDYAATYRTLGGGLPAEVLDTAPRAAFDYLDVHYADPANHDAFPSATEALVATSEGRVLPAHDHRFIALVQNVPDRRGLGVIYWPPDGISLPGLGSSGENLALFDFDGYALAELDAFADVALAAAPAPGQPDLALRLAPNPAANTVAFHLAIHTPGSPRLAVYDALGRASPGL